MVETPMRLNNELIISGIIFIAACLLLYVASGFAPSRMSDQVGPALWPKAILLMIMVLSAVQLVQQTVSAIRKTADSTALADSTDKTGSRMLLLTIILSLLYGFSVSYVGFLLSIFVFQILFLLILDIKNLKALILYPVCLTSVIYAIFIKVLYIPLPRGSGIFLTISRIFY
jgi:putative tricarboxylic transport membrane protein